MSRVPKVDASVLETHIIKYRNEIVKEDGKSKYWRLLSYDTRSSGFFCNYSNEVTIDDSLQVATDLATTRN